MKNITYILGIMVFLLMACGSVPASRPNLTYYVNAYGNDNNNGTTEDAPFKTLQKAIEMASVTSIKKITVIGTIQGNTTTENITPVTSRRIVKVMDGRSSGNLSPIQFGIALLDGSYDAHHPGEILITGKPDATTEEKAVLTNSGIILEVLNHVIRLEYLEITGSNECAILVARGDLTLGRGVKVTKNKVHGIYIHRGFLIMRDDAEVSYNEGVDNVGIYLENGSVGILLNNSAVTYNVASNNGGGIALSGSTLIMRNNSTVSNNTAGNGGGGIITYTDNSNSYYRQITITDNAKITNNTAKLGGGILLQNRLILQGFAQITNN